jgi:hypothetical protein
MRTFLISYDLAKPHLTKHVVAQAIMSAGESWARPLEQTWYVRSNDDETALEHWLSRFIDTDDGLLIQAVADNAVLTNTSLRWFRQRRAGIEVDQESNVIAFPMAAHIPVQSELPFAKAV